MKSWVKNQDGVQLPAKSENWRARAWFAAPRGPDHQICSRTTSKAAKPLWLRAWNAMKDKKCHMSFMNSNRCVASVLTLHFAACIATSIYAGENMQNFIVNGIVSSEGYQYAEGESVLMSRTEGSFSFCYSNAEWQIQFIYKTDYSKLFDSHKDIAGTLIDVKRIPDGIREIYTFPTNSRSGNITATHLNPEALAKTNTFPDWDSQAIFLPWLALCPYPDLPFVSSNRMQMFFGYDYLGDRNSGNFYLEYITPQSAFVNTLIVTNSGFLFLVDGGTKKLPPPYNDGFPQFSYNVTDFTNCGGIKFPFSTTLIQYAPTYNPFPNHLHPAVKTRLQVLGVDVGARKLKLIPAATNLVALDSRENLKNGATVNYNVVNDQWPPLTNKRLQKITHMIERHDLSQNKLEDRSKNVRIIFFVCIGLISAPIIWLIFATNIHTNKQNKHHE